MTREGNIYLMFDGECHKIGRTQNIKRRLGQYRDTGHNMTLVHTFVVSDTYAWEDYLRKRFKPYLVKRNEWFALPESEIDWFRGLTSETERFPPIPLTSEQKAKAEAYSFKMREKTLKWQRERRLGLTTPQIKWGNIGNQQAARAARELKAAA